jgi:hypothetical protein
VSLQVLLFASSHAVPFSFAGWPHAPLLHASVVHWLPSSAHGAVLLMWAQPLLALQESSVQGLLSLHSLLVVQQFAIDGY